ncbi:hypothetical protein ABIB45_000876 [Arthrobacter sp. UYCo732]
MVYRPPVASAMLANMYTSYLKVPGASQSFDPESWTYVPVSTITEAHLLEESTGKRVLFAVRVLSGTGYPGGEALTPYLDRKDAEAALIGLLYQMSVAGHEAPQIVRWNGSTFMCEDISRP